MLLTLVTDITYGHPTLKSGDEKRYQPALESSQTGHILALNAVAALLVRDSEIVATAAYGAVPQVVKDSITHIHREPPSESISCQLFATLEEPRLEDVVVSDLRYTFKGFTTVTNPDDKDRTLDNMCTAISPGESHWSSLKSDKWFGLTLKCGFFFIIFDFLFTPYMANQKT